MPPTALLTPAQQEPLPIQWADWPARRRPGATAVVALSVLAVGVIAGVRIGSPACALLVIALLASSLVNYLLPVWYTLDSEGLSTRGLIGGARIKWTHADAARLGSHDATLMVTRSHQTRTKPFHFCYMEKGEAVYAALRRQLLDAGSRLV